MTEAADNEGPQQGSTEQATARYVPRPWETQFLKAVARVYGIAPASRLAKVPVRTVYSRIENHPRFKERIEEARRIYCDELEFVVSRKAADDPAFAFKVLERLRRKEWGPQRQQVDLDMDVESTEGSPLNVSLTIKAVDDGGVAPDGD